MKRITCFLLGFLIVITMLGCEKIEMQTNLGIKVAKQAEINQYINTMQTELEDLENQLLESYKSVTGENYTSDTCTYTEFSNTTIVLARELSAKALELSYEITDNEILEVHRLYINYANRFLSALGMMIPAVENHDYEQAAEANKILNEANNFALDYRIALNNLVEKYKLTISP